MAQTILDPTPLTRCELCDKPTARPHVSPDGRHAYCGQACLINPHEIARREAERRMEAHALEAALSVWADDGGPPDLEPVVLTVAGVRALLARRDTDCSDLPLSDAHACPGWCVIESGRGLELQVCDDCANQVRALTGTRVTDDDVALLPEAQRALVAEMA